MLDSAQAGIHAPAHQGLEHTGHVDPAYHAAAGKLHTINSTTKATGRLRSDKVGGSFSFSCSFPTQKLIRNAGATLPLPNVHAQKIHSKMAVAAISDGMGNSLPFSFVFSKYFLGTHLTLKPE